MKPAKTFIATVVSAGRMQQAVKVRTSKQRWNSRIQKSFSYPVSHLVSDPTSALYTGDVIRVTPEPHSRHIKHVVTEIISPWGVDLADRPAVLTNEERAALKAEMKARKMERREEEMRRPRERGEEGFLEEEEEVMERGRDRKVMKEVKKTEREREKGARNGGVTGRVQRGLDERGSSRWR